MRLKQLTIQNFMSISNVEINLDGAGLTLILGENKDDKNFSANGVGKSALIEAVIYAIFGKTLRGLTGDSVINRVAGKNMKITLTIESGGSEYKVLRYRKHHENKNQSILFKDATNITPKSESDLNSFMQDLFQIDFSTFTSSVLYSEHSFNFSTATDSELKKAFDVILGFDTLVKCQDKAKELVKNLSGELNTLEVQLNGFKNRVDEIDDKIGVYEVKSHEFDKNRRTEIKSLKEKISVNNSKSETLGKEILEKSKEVDASKEVVTKLTSESRAIRQEFEDSKTTYNEALASVKVLEKTLYDAKSEVSKNETLKTSVKASITRIEKKISSVDAEVELTKGKIGKPCPSCGVPLEAGGVEEVLKSLKKTVRLLHLDIEDLQDELTELDSKRPGLLSKVEKYELDLVKLNENVKEELSKLDSTKVDKIMGDLSSAKQKLTSLESSLKILNRDAESLLADNDRLSKQIESIQNQENPYLEMVNSLETEQETLESKIVESEKEIDSKNVQIAHAKFWVEGFGSSGIKSRLLDDVTPFLNSRTNKYLQFLTEDSITVEFSTQQQLKTGEFREKFNIQVLNKHGGDSYIGNSGGERKRVDLAITLALQDLVASRANQPLNIVFFDEIFDALDNVGIERVAELLQDTAKDKSSVFVVSHNPELKTYFDSELVLVKENGKTTLKE